MSKDFQFGQKLIDAMKEGIDALSNNEELKSYTVQEDTSHSKVVASKSSNKSSSRDCDLHTVLAVPKK